VIDRKRRVTHLRTTSARQVRSHNQELSRATSESGHFGQARIICPKLDTEFECRRADDRIRQLQLVLPPELHSSRANRSRQFANSDLPKKFADLLFSFVVSDGHASSSISVMTETPQVPAGSGSANRPPSRYKATFVSSSPVIATRRGRAAAMRADLAAIGWLPRIWRDREDPSPAVGRLRAIPGTGVAFFSAPTAMHLQPLRFHPGCSQRLEISTSVVTRKMRSACGVKDGTPLLVLNPSFRIRIKRPLRHMSPLH
jgi:hypothetical protein